MRTRGQKRNKFTMIRNATPGGARKGSLCDEALAAWLVAVIKVGQRAKSCIQATGFSEISMEELHRVKMDERVTSCDIVEALPRARKQTWRRKRNIGIGWPGCVSLSRTFHSNNVKPMRPPRVGTSAPNMVANIMRDTVHKSQPLSSYSVQDRQFTHYSY